MTPNPADLPGARGLKGLSSSARIGLSVIVCIGVILLAGWIYERLGERADAVAYPPAGVLIKVDDHRLHIHCLGPLGAGPTIVLENGLGGWSQTWGNVQTELAKTARTCAYDRAGYGWSELGDRPHDAINTADQLHALLHGSGEVGPYVLVGASIGGMYIRMYTHRYPGDVAGLVFLDPAHEDQLQALPHEEYAKDRDKPEGWKEWAARFGYFRWKYHHGDPPRDQDVAAVQAHLSAPYYYMGKRRDIDDWTKTDAEVRATGSLGGVPLIVLSAGSGKSPAFTAARQALHARIARLSSAGTQEIVPQAAHASLIFNPEHSKYTIAAVRKIWSAAKAGIPAVADADRTQSVDAPPVRTRPSPMGLDAFRRVSAGRGEAAQGRCNTTPGRYANERVRWHADAIKHKLIHPLGLNLNPK